MNYYEWQTIDASFTVRFDKSTLEELAEYRQTIKGNEPESLGILVGEVWENAFWVRYATKPNNYDKLSRFLCERTEESAKTNYQILKFLNIKSGNRWHYLGEWHTHPQTLPSPSTQDYMGWSLLPDNTYFNRNIRLFMICSSDNHNSDWLSIQIDGIFYKLILKI